jgi:hypothetical protein
MGNPWNSCIDLVHEQKVNDRSHKVDCHILQGSVVPVPSADVYIIVN